MERPERSQVVSVLAIIGGISIGIWIGRMLDLDAFVVRALGLVGFVLAGAYVGGWRPLGRRAS